MTADPREILAEVRDELSHADQKAATLLSAFMVVVAVVSAALLAGQWSPKDLSSRWSAVWWCAEALAVLAVGCLGAAVWPRTGARRRLPAGSTYYGDIARLHETDALAAALARQDATDRVVAQLLAVSKVVTRKYALIRAGMVCAGLAAGLGIMVGLFSS